MKIPAMLSALILAASLLPGEEESEGITAELREVARDVNEGSVDLVLRHFERMSEAQDPRLTAPVGIVVDSIGPRVFEVSGEEEAVRLANGLGELLEGHPELRLRVYRGFADIIDAVQPSDGELELLAKAAEEVRLLEARRIVESMEAHWRLGEALVRRWKYSAATEHLYYLNSVNTIRMRDAKLKGRAIEIKIAAQFALIQCLRGQKEDLQALKDSLDPIFTNRQVLELLDKAINSETLDIDRQLNRMREEHGPDPLDEEE